MISVYRTSDIEWVKYTSSGKCRVYECDKKWCE